MATSDWVQATDPASGDPYWWNEVTGESTWENPFPAAAGTHKLLPSRARASLQIVFLTLLGIRDEGGHCDRGYITLT